MLEIVAIFQEKSLCDSFFLPVGLLSFCQFSVSFRFLGSLHTVMFEVAFCFCITGCSRCRHRRRGWGYNRKSFVAPTKGHS
jgi:hypothetical protein